MNYKLVIFDFDGTLADSFPFFLSSINDLAETYGFRKVDAAEADAFRGYDAKHILKQLGIPLWKVPSVAAGFRKAMAKRADEIPVFPGVETMLRTLSREGVVLSLITSNSRENVQRILGEEVLALMVHAQFGTSLFGKAPKLKSVLKKTGIDPRETISIGDEVRDLDAAHAVGTDFGAVAWGYTHADALLKRSPEQMLYSVEEIVMKVTPRGRSGRIIRWMRDR